MSEPVFFQRGSELTAREIADATGAGGMLDAGIRIADIAALERAGPRDLAFFDHPRHKDAAAKTRAGICLTTERLAPFVRDGVLTLHCTDPYAAFVTVAQRLFPQAERPSSLFEASGIGSTHVHPTARLESGVTVEPGAVVGPRAEVGSGTVIGPMAVVGAGARIGRDCMVGAGAVVTHALVGDRVKLRAGSHVGQEGLGIADGAPRRFPAVGRVIIQDAVEIGAGTTVDRGALGDTLIGEASKIDDLVFIGGDASIGRHCVVASQAGIAGGATLEDHVVLGARVGIERSVTIGEGARIAAFTDVRADVPPGGISEIR